MATSFPKIEYAIFDMDGLLSESPSWSVQSILRMIPVRAYKSTS